MKLKAFLAHISHRLGGPVAAEIGGGIDVVNLAGAWLYSRPWRFMERMTAPVALVVDQNYAALPTGFAGLMGINTTTLLGYPVSWHGPSEIDLLRAQGFETLPYHVVVESTDDGQRLAIFPAPSVNDADSVTITYRAQWADLVEEDDEPSCAAWFLPLLIETVREYAAGVEGGDLAVRLATIEAGPLMRAARVQDGTLQANMGPMLGGAVASISGGWPDWTPITVEDQ